MTYAQGSLLLLLLGACGMTGGTLLLQRRRRAVGLLLMYQGLITLLAGAGLGVYVLLGLVQG